MNRLAALSFTPQGEINEEVSSWALSNLTRSQLKAYLAALRREARRRTVYVELSGGTESEVSDAIEEQYPSRELVVHRDDGLGAGVKVSAGDDIVDASVKGYLKKLIEEISKA